MTKTDTLRVIAASHVILAVVLIGISPISNANSGVLLLQGGQWYAELAAIRELQELEAEEAKKTQ
jgi:ER membrane protein SH3